MNTVSQRTKATRIIFLIAGALLAVAIMLLFTGCTKQVVENPLPAAATATPVSEAEPSAPPVNENIKAFGDVKTWDDGVSLSVSAPSAFTPSESALGAVPGQAMVVFTFVLTNGSDAALDPMVFPTASSGGTEAELIYDSGNALGIVSNGPTTSLLPGQVVQWYVAFSVVDVNDITLEASPSFAHQNVIFTNVAF